MPFGDGRADLLRVVEGLEGEVEMVHEWVVRTGYGAVVPWVSRAEGPDGSPVIRAVAGPDMLVLRGDRLPRAATTSTATPSPCAPVSAWSSR